jgi:hypothetical protein
MSARTELAERFMAALLARDPLPSQRYTEIEKRVEQLAHVAQMCAVTFLTVDRQWEEGPQHASAVAKRIWDYSSAPERSIPVPEKLAGAGSDGKSASDLFGGR